MYVGKKQLGAVAGTIGLLLLAVGAYLGFAGISKDGRDCGSAFKPELVFSLAGESSCTDAAASRKTLATALLIPGAALSILGVFTFGVERTEEVNAREKEADSVASK